MSTLPHDPAETSIFSIRLRPHRSLSRSQLRILLAVVAAVGVVTSVPFVILGAWPVAGFFGLDVLMVYAAFTISVRAARAYEDVNVTPLALSLEKVSSKGARRIWNFNPSWVRLERKNHEEFGLQRIDLVSRGSRIEVAGFLGPDAKADFADRLGHALAEARRGPRYS